MSDRFQGFCMRCKSYVDIESPKMITMRNGRTRVAGFCTSKNCDGRISKIVA